MKIMTTRISMRAIKQVRDGKRKCFDTEHIKFEKIILDSEKANK
jgi:hypothetical protein